jgi:hypothetical protein
MRRVVIHIDRLVLKGVPAGDRHAFAAGLRQEMERLFADPQAGLRLIAQGDRQRLPVGTVQGGVASTARTLGERVAQGIGKGALA